MDRQVLLDGFDKAGREVLVQIGVDGAGSDGVDPDAVVAEDDCQIPAEDVQTPLAALYGAL